MNKYNLYRIRKDQEESLIAKLESSGMERTGEREIEGYRLSFYFSREPAPAPIWWADTYADLLPGGERPQNLMYYGVLLLSNSDSCYAVSLGKSHFYLRDFCDSDFGLDVAERIADPRDVRTKNSKFFQSRKSKTITTYQKGSEVEYGAAESFHYVRARTLDRQRWGEVASFGTSAQFTLREGYEVLPRLIGDIEGQLRLEPQFRLPRVESVTDESKIAELNNKLVDAIMQATQTVRFDDLVLSGVEFVFPEASHYKFFVKGRRSRQKRLQDLSLDALLAFVQENQLDLREELERIRVYVHNDYGSSYSRPLKAYLDYVDDPDYYCLIEGEWKKLSQSYVDYLRREVARLQVELDPQQFAPDEDEPALIARLASTEGYTQLHGILQVQRGGYRVEIGDLYRDGALFHVKAGPPRKLVYAIDQALASLDYLKSHERQVDLGGEKLAVRKVYLWLIVDRHTAVSSLTDIRSLILHMRLVEWKTVARDADFEPVVRITHRAQSSRTSEAA